MCGLNFILLFPMIMKLIKCMRNKKKKAILHRQVNNYLQCSYTHYLSTNTKHMNLIFESSQLTFQCSWSIIEPPFLCPQKWMLFAAEQVVYELLPSLLRPMLIHGPLIPPCMDQTSYSGKQQGWDYTEDEPLHQSGFRSVGSSMWLVSVM
jgi:hypothetical protein